MKLAFFEFICCSGNFRAPSLDASAEDTSSLLREGFAMFEALGSDLLASGIKIRSAIEPSIADWAASRGFDARAWCIESIAHNPGQSLQQTADLWVKCARHCDAAMVIAPELDGTLITLIGALRASGIRVIASSRDFLENTSDKWRTHLRWQASGVRHPRTWLLSDWLEAYGTTEPEHGWVVKRRDSAGAVDLVRFPAASLLIDAARHRDTKWRDKDAWIVQPWVSGRPASIGILAGEAQFHVLGAFEQHFSMSNEQGAGLAPTGLAYCGGRGPLNDVSIERLKPFVERVLTAIPGKAEGWIGIDFLIEPDDLWTVIEINARVTSSYLGYRQLYGTELALALLRGEPPHQELSPNASCCFSVGDFHG